MTFHRILPCVTSAAFGLCASLAAQADHALVIGGHGGEGDADRFVNALVTSGEFDRGDITVLTGPDLSRDTVINALITDLPSQTNAGDKVLIYYSGLGGQRAGAGAADEPDGLDEVFILDPVSGASLMDNEIETTIDQLEGRYVSVFLDTAFASAADVPTIVGYRGSGQINGAVEGLLGAALGVDLPKIPDVPEDGADVVDAALPLAQDLAEENGPLKTQNPKAQIFSASTPQTGAWEDETGGAFTTTLIDSIENNAADQNSNGDLSSAEFITYARESLADLCKSIVHCEATNMAFSPAVVVANDRLASLGGGISADGQIVSDGLIADGEPFAATIPNMSHDQRVGFVSDRFGSINRAGLKLSVAPRNTMRVGDVVEFELSAAANGNFVLIDVDPLGRVVQVYPSSLSPRTASVVSAGAQVRIPSVLSTNGMPLRIRVTPPVGQGLLMAIFVEGDFAELETVLPEDLAGQPVDDGFAFLYDLADSLMGLYASVGPAPPIWSTQYLEYEIVN
ncbi:MAG: DUF4384 domain-containing protein [Pseudomonadota bacterium]